MPTIKCFSQKAGLYDPVTAGSVVLHSLASAIMCAWFPHAGHAVVSVDSVNNILFHLHRYQVCRGQIAFADSASWS